MAPLVAGLTTPWKERSGSPTLGVWTAKNVELVAPNEDVCGKRVAKSDARDSAVKRRIDEELSPINDL
ncbi:MAG: hypothetical protein ACKO29_01350 [Actinomycetota bacterium]